MYECVFSCMCEWMLCYFCIYLYIHLFCARHNFSVLLLNKCIASYLRVFYKVVMQFVKKLLWKEFVYAHNIDLKLKKLWINKINDKVEIIIFSNESTFFNRFVNLELTLEHLPLKSLISSVRHPIRRSARKLMMKHLIGVA